jgi:hypothetical protein
MKDAWSDDMKTTALAISSGKPSRLIGSSAASPALTSSVPVNRFSIPVSIGPGATQAFSLSSWLKVTAAHSIRISSRGRFSDATF